MTGWISRELAFQIAEQFAVLGAALNVRTAVIVGGMDMIAQALELNTLPHIIIATPGRIVDHLRSSSGEWNLTRVKFLVCTVGTCLVKTSNNCIRSLMKLIDF
jgi:ATP-dependent RNA helicase DDX49/DBP8